ncbi:DUF2274 domain-containing protein [Bradyrhizobium ontarionense]|uniref:DUF2274 domain-containing protein n=1 Tax=Bradyrhizobium ontarionense TaxID=2898149 RepID=A0ABY3R5R5_9BRAD|nr:DUF2274 domain-containing protein [Bradyrhizobium sp. A19]UFZ02645.1 DUF2274 domain-containing protein [Bradyrhizobium sp. A19]
MKLKISTLPDEKPVKISVEMPAAVHRDLLTYIELIASQSGQEAVDPGRLVAAMVKSFMGGDRTFLKLKGRASGPPLKK